MAEGEEKMENVWNLDKLLKDCDYICNVLPKTPQTNNILGKGKLELCKGNRIVVSDQKINIKNFFLNLFDKTCISKLSFTLGKEYGTVFINIGRSNVIREDDLLEALEKNWIRETILDVFDTGKQSQDYL